MPKHGETQSKQLERAAEQHYTQLDDNGEILDRAIEATERNPSLDDFAPAKVRSAASFTLDNERGQALWWIASNGKHADLADSVGCKLSVVDWITYCKEVVRTDGSIDPAGMVTCLFLADNTCVSWASPTTNRQWCNIVKVKGTGPYSLPLECMIVANKSETKGKGDWYSILPWKEDQ